MSDLYLIRKGGAYYRPNCRGYTTSAILAGRYTLKEVLRETYPNGPDGPRDGMRFIRESDIKDEDLIAHCARIAALKDELAEARLDAIASQGQAAEAHGAQLAAEAKLAKAMRAAWSLDTAYRFKDAGRILSTAQSVAVVEARAALAEIEGDV